MKKVCPNCSVIQETKNTCKYHLHILITTQCPAYAPPPHRKHPPRSPTQGFPPERDNNYDKLDPATRVCAAPRRNTYIHTTVWKYLF